MTAAKPTDAEIAAARDLLTRAATADAAAPRAALIDLVTSKAFAEVERGFAAAFQLNPADTDVAYLVSMLARIRTTNAPA